MIYLLIFLAIPIFFSMSEAASKFGESSGKIQIAALCLVVLAIIGLTIAAKATTDEVGKLGFVLVVIAVFGLLICAILDKF